MRTKARGGFERLVRWPTSEMRTRGLLLFLFILALSAASVEPAVAGPPFRTDDPQPVDFRHWEAYFFSTLDRTTDGRAIQFPALEFNWGVVPNVQLHWIVPLASSRPPGGPTRFGAGDMELGVKYRFIQEAGKRPQIGIFPQLELPTGNVNRGLGNGQVYARLPLWVQKSWGPWTSYGGGGGVVNRAPGMRSHALAGWLLQRDLGKRVTLGGEIYSEGSTSLTTHSSTVVDLGGYYNFSSHFSLLFSAGRDISGGPHTLAYLGLYWTWGGGADKGPKRFPPSPLRIGS
jgi:hypothetical protein